jgi:O-antigen/teichoic acid export membrane protein
MTSAADPAAQTTGAKVMRGGAWTAVSSVLPQLYTVAISIVAARFLGPSEFGRQSFIAFVALSVFQVLTTGIALTLMRSVAENLGRGRGDEAQGLIAWAWRLQTAAALVGGGGLVVVALAGADPRAAWALAGAFVGFGVLQSVANAVLLGAQRFRAAALVGMVTGGVTVPLTIGVLVAGGGITGIFAVEAAVAAANLVWTALLARAAVRDLPPAVPAPAALRRAALAFAGWATAGAVVTLVVWRRSEFVFLAHYASDAEIGLYSIAFAAVSALSALPERLSTVLISAFATLRGADAQDRIRWGYGRSLRLLVLLALPLAAGVAAVGPAFLRLIYGEDYRGAGAVLVVLVAALPFLAVSSISSALLQGLDDARTPLLVGLGAAVVNVVLAFALIPRHAAVGAAWASAGAQIAAGAGMYACARRVTGPADWRPGSLGRCALASAGCAGAARAVLAGLGGVAGFLVATLAGAAAFGLLALALRILSRDDVEWLSGHLGHLAGGRARTVLQRLSSRA